MIVVANFVDCAQEYSKTSHHRCQSLEWMVLGSGRQQCLSHLVPGDIRELRACNGFLHIALSHLLLHRRDTFSFGPRECLAHLGSHWISDCIRSLGSRLLHRKAIQRAHQIPWLLLLRYQNLLLIWVLLGCWSIHPTELFHQRSVIYPSILLNCNRSHGLHCRTEY